MSSLKGKEYKRFEDIKHIREDGSEYWSARELAPALEYTQWRNFENVIKRAMIACENSGHSILDDFAEVSKIVEAGATSKPKKDYELSRYACYLIVQNGDPRKQVIALGQTYFAIQTYRQEIADHYNQLDEDRRRLVVRGDIKQWNQLLAGNVRIETSIPWIDEKNAWIEHIKSLRAKGMMTAITSSAIISVLEDLRESQVIGTQDVKKILDCKETKALRIITEMKKAGIIVAVTGQGKGRYILSI